MNSHFTKLLLKPNYVISLTNIEIHNIDDAWVAGRKICELGVGTSIITMGDKGVLCTSNSDDHNGLYIPSYKLKEKQISLDHFSLINLTNFSKDILLESATRTGKVLLIDNGWVKCSIVKDILCDLYISGFRGEGQIMGYANSPCPTPRALENAYYPTPTSIAMEILKMLNKSTDLFIPESPELASFKGPF